MPTKKSPAAQRAEAMKRLKKKEKDKKIQEGFSKTWDPLSTKGRKK